MAASIYEQINAALFTRCQQVAGAHASRNLDAAAQEFPAVIYRDAEPTDDLASVWHVQSEMHPTIEGIVAPDGTAATLEDLRDALYLAVFAAVCAPDPTLGGLAIDVRQVKVTPDVLTDLYQGPVQGFALELQVLFQWIEGRPDVAA